MSLEYEHDGHTYKLEKLGLSDAKETLAKLQTMGFFEDGLTALISSPESLDELERRLFRQHASWLNETGSWVPLGKELTENHFAGRIEAYLSLIVKAVGYNFESFLAGGWTTGLVPEEASPE